MSENNTPNQAPSNLPAPITKKKSLVMVMAENYNMEPEHFLDAVKQTCMPTKDVTITNGMLAAFLMVCHEYNLNPLVREIFAFPTKRGGLQPIVSVDGWVKLITTHPQYGGMDKLVVEVDPQTKKPISCTCHLLRKDGMPVPEVTEYFDECYRNTDPWNNMPKRMMRHKGIKEAGRIAFGFGGLMDQDEGMDAINITDQSTVLERSTNDAKEALKEKIGAKKGAKAVASEPSAPMSPEPPKQSAPATPKAQTPTPSPAPEQTVIQPQPVVEAQPEALVSDEQRKQFINKASARATELGATEDQTRSKMREIIFNLGYTKYIEIPASKFAETMAAFDSWTLVDPTADI